MLLLELNNIVKYVGERRLFKIDNLKIYLGDRIGVVGVNGVGKTMLLQIITGKVQPDEGQVWQYHSYSYIPQLDTISEQESINPVLARQFNIDKEYSETMSGGEKTRYKIASALSEGSSILLADEPTANLDIKGIELLQQKLQEFDGALVIVSHDRTLLEEECNTVWELNNERVTVYTGKFRDYLAEKERERKRQEHEYESYIAEKKKLEAAVADRRQRAASMRKTPKRMGNSEARLHKMGNQKAKANLYKAVKAMENRLDQLEVKEKPRNAPAVVFDVTNANDLQSKIVLRGDRISKSFGSRILYDNAEFSVLKGQKVALLGDNGCGKTTLLNMIAAREEGMYISPKVRFGYSDQAMKGLDLNSSALANVMETSIYDEGFVRNLLAQLLFRGDEVFKRVAVLSGGERTRIALAKIIASDANVLILDEPTNYLDFPSMAALETVLAAYHGVILFASHDRKFINTIATHLMLFESGKIKLFQGNYEQYVQHRREKKEKLSNESRLLLEYRLAEVLSKLSIAKSKETIECLDKEYRELLAQLKI